MHDTIGRTKYIVVDWCEPAGRDDFIRVLSLPRWLFTSSFGSLRLSLTNNHKASG